MSVLARARRRRISAQAFPVVPGARVTCRPGCACFLSPRRVSCRTGDVRSLSPRGGASFRGCTFPVAPGARVSCHPEGDVSCHPGCASFLSSRERAFSFDPGACISCRPGGARFLSSRRRASFRGGAFLIAPGACASCCSGGARFLSPRGCAFPVLSRSFHGALTDLSRSKKTHISSIHGF